MESFWKEFKDPFHKICKEHERESGEETKGSPKLSQEGLKRVKIHLVSDD